MATAAQRAWLKRGREQAASTPPPTTRTSTSGGGTYRGPTAAQIKARTLAATPATTEHRKSSRTAALTQSGVRAGQTPAQAAAESTKAVYGAQSTQAKQAQVTLINEQKLAASRRSVIKDLRTGVIGGVQVVMTPPSISGKYFKTPHVKTQVDPHIHILTETLAGKKIADYPTVASKIASMQKNQRRAYLQLTSDASKLQTAQSQLYLAEQRLNKYPVKDGKFVGTEAQYNKYLADHAKYIKKYNEVDGAIREYNSDIGKAEIEGYKLEKLETKTRRAQYAGLVGKYEDIELKVSEKIPTLHDMSKKGAAFRRKHPEVAATIYTTFEKAHAKTEDVGTQSQRNALAGYTYGSYSSLQKQPVKTAASFAIGGASVKAIKMASFVGKAFGAGIITKRMAQAAQLGLVSYYGYKSTKYIMSAPNSYVAGQRAANIMYTEVLPMAAGIKAVTVAPKVTKIVTRKAGFISREFKAGTKRMLADDRAMVTAGKTKTQRLAELVKSEEKRLKRPLLESEYNALKSLTGIKKPKTIKTATDIFKKIEAKNKRKLASGEYKEVKIGTGAQQQIQLVKVVQKPLTKQTLKQVVKVKEQFELISKPVVKPKVVQKQVQKVKVLTASQKAEAARLQKQATLKQAAYQKEMQTLADQMPAFKRKVMVKTVQKQVSKSKTIKKQIIQLKQKYNQKLITRQVYMQKLAQLNKQKLKLAQQQTQLQKTVTKVKTLTAQKFAQQLTTSFAVMQLFKQAQKQEAKLKAKQLAKQKQKIVPLLTPKQEAALITKQKIAAARKVAAAEKVAPKPPRKVTPKPVRKPAIKEPKLIVPPTVTFPKRKAKKKPIRKDRQIVTYTPIQFKNRVATIASLFG